MNAHNLLIISHTPHSYVGEKIWGWSPTVQEVNFLKSKFTVVTHIAPIHKQISTISFEPIHDDIIFIPVKNRGGTQLLDKLKVLLDSYNYFIKINQEVAKHDIIHVRCPANIALIALLILLFYPKKLKWIKYAGNWKLQGSSNCLTYRLQKWIAISFLKRRCITHNDFYAPELPFIKAVTNPSLEYSTWINNKEEVSRKKLTPSYKLLFCGRTEHSKGMDILLEVFTQLSSRARQKIELIIVGDSETEGMKYRNKVLYLNNKNIHFEGWKKKDEIIQYYLQSHFIILPSNGEGWPKVLSEGMACGCVPISSNVSGISFLLNKLQTGRCAEKNSVDEYIAILTEYLNNPEQWKKESEKGYLAGTMFTYQEWYKSINQLIVSIP